MARSKQKTGFTVVELLVAMVAFGILVLTVTLTLICTWMSWGDFTDSVNMQRDAMIAMKVMAKEIRNSSISEISGDADSLDFSAGVVRGAAASFSKADIAVSKGVVLNSWADPVIGSNKVTVAFTLGTNRGTDQNFYSMSIYPRN